MYTRRAESHVDDGNFQIRIPLCFSSLSMDNLARMATIQNGPHHSCQLVKTRAGAFFDRAIFLEARHASSSFPRADLDAARVSIAVCIFSVMRIRQRGKSRSHGRRVSCGTRCMVQLFLHKKTTARRAYVPKSRPRPSFSTAASN